MMMKNYKKLCSLIILTTLVAINASGQLSGNYTIDNSIAVSATNFTSFTQFASTLNVSGVAGGGATVTVNGAAVYTEQIAITNNAMTASNALVIDGNGRTLNFAGGTLAVPHTLLLSGADFLTIKNLKIDATNTANAWAVHLWNGANNNTFKTCTITCLNNQTATNLVPVSISNSSSNNSTTGNGGNDNTWDGCLISGGYYGVQMYGLTSSPFSFGNKIMNGRITDFHYMGVYMMGYQVDFVVSNNVFDRPTRTIVANPCYGVYLGTSPLRNVVEKNHFNKIYDLMPTTTAGFVGIYVAASATPNNEIRIRNNVVSDVRSNGYIYGIYVPGYTNVFIEHNTVSIDDQSGSNIGANTVYGIYTTAAPSRILNNIVSITRSGPGTKYGLYYGTITTFTSNGNVVYTTNNANFGYITAARATYTAWTANSPYDVIGSNVDPMFTNTVTMDYVPTNTLINNTAVPIGLVDDKSSTPRSLIMPDPGAFEMYTNSCSGSPITGSVVGPTLAICPGMTVNLQLPVTGYLFSGFSIQWQASTLSIAGYTSIPSATLTSQIVSPNATTYYTALVTCNSNSLSTAAVPLGIVVAALTNSTVPYKESFETLAINKLPNCNWSASSLVGGIAGGNTITYTTSSANGRYPRTGSNFAAFTNTPAGQHYFYTNGIQLNAGVTYSASMWYITESTGATNFTNLSILVGPGQTPAGQQTIASTNGPAQSVIYKQLTDTFKVNTSGIYYVSVRATSSVGVAQYLSWDDLEITIPCQYNGPPMLIGSSAQSTVCSGQTIILNAAGAASYTWNTGQNGNVITAIAPNVLNPTPYDFSVVGLNAISGCTASLSHNFMINPSPSVYAVANNPSICQGQPAVLTALGANTYVWAHGANGPYTTVTPSVATTYSVNGTNSYGCINSGTVLVLVNPTPTIIAVANSTAICVGEDLQLDATGATTYNWTSSTGGVHFGPSVTLKPTTSTVYNVTATGANGCTKNASVIVAVNECTGVLEDQLQDFELFPNPVNQILNIKFSPNTLCTLKLYDVAGKLIHSQEAAADKEMINMSGYNAGVYTLMVLSDQNLRTFKVVKVD